MHVRVHAAGPTAPSQLCLPQCPPPSPCLQYNSTLVGHIIALGVQLCVVELRQQCPGAQITVLGLLPLQPLMLRAPQRLFDGMVEAANGELRGFVEADASGKLAFKGKWLRLGEGRVRAAGMCGAPSCNLPEAQMFHPPLQAPAWVQTAATGSGGRMGRSTTS